VRLGLGRARRGFSIREAAQPSPARPCAPLAPTPSPCAPFSLSLSHLDLPRNNLPLLLPPLSPRGALGIGDDDHRNLDPEVSSPARGGDPARPLPAAAPAPPPARRRAAPAPSPARGGAAPPAPCSRAPAPPPAPLPATAPPAPCSPGAAPGGSAPARPQPLRASFWPLAWFAWPRASPFTASAFPRAQPALAVIIFVW
jgi:hypothetical protein